MNHKLNKIYRPRDSIEYVHEMRTGNLLVRSQRWTRMREKRADGRINTISLRGLYGIALLWREVWRCYGTKIEWEWGKTVNTRLVRLLWYCVTPIEPARNETHMFLPRARVYITRMAVAVNKVYLITVMYWSFLRFSVLATCTRNLAL